MSKSKRKRKSKSKRKRNRILDAHTPGSPAPPAGQPGARLAMPRQSHQHQSLALRFPAGTHQSQSWPLGSCPCLSYPEMKPREQAGDEHTDGHTREKRTKDREEERERYRERTTTKWAIKREAAAEGNRGGNRLKKDGQASKKKRASSDIEQVCIIAHILVPLAVGALLTLSTTLRHSHSNPY